MGCVWGGGEEEMAPILKALARASIHAAAEAGDVQALLHHVALSPGAEHAISSRGEVPLHCAARCGKAGVVEVLLALGADVEVLDALGKTPFWHAVESGSVLTVGRVLADAGANVDLLVPGTSLVFSSYNRRECESQQWTPLRFVQYKGYPTERMVEAVVLVCRGATNDPAFAHDRGYRRKGSSFVGGIQRCLQHLRTAARGWSGFQIATFFGLEEEMRWHLLKGGHQAVPSEDLPRLEAALIGLPRGLDQVFKERGMFNRVKDECGREEALMAQQMQMRLAVSPAFRAPSWKFWSRPMHVFSSAQTQAVVTTVLLAMRRLAMRDGGDADGHQQGVLVLPRELWTEVILCCLRRNAERTPKPGEARWGN